MRYFKLLFYTIALSAAIQVPCFADNESLAQRTAQDFTTVAKEAIPAVVSIQVKGSSSTKGRGAQSDDSDLFGEDFFQQFFFSPRHERKQSQEFTGQASGFIVSKDGYLMTNGHVVKDVSEIKVTLNDGREFEGKLIGTDPNTDIAIVKIDATDLPQLTFGDSDKAEIGEWVIAIGNPLGLQASLTVGVVSAKGRNNLDLTAIEDFIQTDAAINRGNSGGPLLNIQGKVIGMNTAIVTDTGTGGYIGIGFAIPSNIAKLIMNQLIQKGSVTRGFIGVTLQAIDKDLAHAFGLNNLKGALVADVAKDSPAERAGLKQGDLIEAYDSQQVPNIVTLRNAIALMAPGKKIVLSIVRNGQPLTLPVEIGIFPTTETKSIQVGDNSLGFEVENITPELAYKLGIEREKGVLITKVNPNTPAAWAGLKQGALILAVNQKEVSNVEEFQAALKSTPENRPVLLLIRQGDAIRFLSLKVN